MAFGKKKVIKQEEIKVQEVVNEEVKTVEEPEIKDEPKVEVKEEKKTSIKKGSKVTANGRCFGSERLECPLKTVRNYETKILEVSEKAVLIDEGWISKENVR